MSFSFGTPSSAPATGLTGGFSFNANKPATPGFGLTAATTQTGGLFGTPTSAAPAFGSTPAFGTATPAFGTASAAPAFGATSTAPAFGVAGTPAFGAATSTPAFGAATSTPAFGATTTPAFGSTAPTFGSTTTPAFGATGLGTGGLNFGANTSTSTGGLSFGANTATSTSGGLSFGAPAATTATGLGGLGGFGLGTSTTNTGFGSFGNTTTTSSGLFGTKLGGTTVTSSQPTSSAAPSLGLGGVTPAGGTANASTGDGKNETPKQIKLPNEIATTVHSFKEFVKKQKSMSSDIMRVSIKPLHQVSRSAEVTLRAAVAAAGAVSRARAQSRRLRASAAAAAAAADAAARDPPGSELEGSAPPLYIKELISELEQQLLTFRRQMDVADKQMQSSPKLLSEQELTLGIRRMHESLVALAGRLQTVHTQVEAQKEQYLNLRKYILKDPTNVFDTPSPSSSLDQILRDAEGTRKKSKTTKVSDITMGSAVLSDPRAALGSMPQLAGPTPFTYFGNTISPFPSADASGSNWQPQPQQTTNTSFNTSAFNLGQTNESSSFQLQKPPGKRGKQ